MFVNTTIDVWVVDRAVPLPGSDDRPRSAAAGLRVEVAAISHRGRVRANNEDAVLAEPPNSPAANERGALCVVADGMGGHAAGEVASQMAVKAVHARYYGSANSQLGEALRAAVQAANDDVYQEAKRHPEKAGMGCTLTAAVIRGEDLFVGHVGDSRAYLVRNGSIAQITADHSWVAQQVAEGVLTPEQARTHPRRNVITRALGYKPSIEVELYQRKIQAGDTLVVCSDGLTNVLGDEEVSKLASGMPPQKAAETLVNLANERGAPDNVTVAIARMAAGKDTGLRHRLRRFWSK